MTEPSPAPSPQPPQDVAGTPSKQHGDPLLAAAEGRGDGEDASRHGYDATAPAAADRESDGG